MIQSTQAVTAPPSTRPSAHPLTWSIRKVRGVGPVEAEALLEDERPVDRERQSEEGEDGKHAEHVCGARDDWTPVKDARDEVADTGDAASQREPGQHCRVENQFDDPEPLAGNGVVGRLGVLLSRDRGCEARRHGITMPRDRHNLSARQPRLYDKMSE